MGTVLPGAFINASSLAVKARRACGSRLPTGLSSSRSGSGTMARTVASFCRWPCDSPLIFCFGSNSQSPGRRKVARVG